MSDDRDRLGERERLLLEGLITRTRETKVRWEALDEDATELRAKAGESEFYLLSLDHDDRAPFGLEIMRGGSLMTRMRTLEARTNEDADLNALLAELFFVAKRSSMSLGDEADAVLRDLGL